MKTIFSKILRSVSFFFVKLCAVIVFCLLFSFAFVYPLWLFAVKKPDIFSAAVLIFFTLAIAAVLVRKIKARSKK